MVLVPGAGDVRERDAGVAAARVDRSAVADVHVDVVDRPVVVAVVELEIAGAGSDRLKSADRGNSVPRGFR